MAIFVLLIIFVWIVAMFYLGVGHISEHGLPKLPKRSKRQPPLPDRSERLAAVRSEFEEELSLLDTLNLNQFEKNAAVLHARQKYTRNIKEVLDG